ncbi:MAG TPA: hypothetical protein PLH94_09875 [Fimbriimonadaceae bacterium]|nr:hypothetical protein [Fimbriimonadaceae bacterium]
MTPRLKLGLEYNPAIDEVNPIGNWIALPESEKTPMVSFGTSSDRIFSPEGTRAYFTTFAKGLPGGRIAPYVSVSYSEWEKRFLFPFGANVVLDEHWDVMGMNDGRNTHLLLTYKMPTSNVTLMLVKMRHVGISYGWSF